MDRTQGKAVIQVKMISEDGSATCKQQISRVNPVEGSENRVIDHKRSWPKLWRVIGEQQRRARTTENPLHSTEPSGNRQSGLHWRELQGKTYCPRASSFQVRWSFYLLCTQQIFMDFLVSTDTVLGTEDVVWIRLMWFQSFEIFSVIEQTIVKMMLSVLCIQQEHSFSRVKQSRLIPLVPIFYILER